MKKILSVIITIICITTIVSGCSGQKETRTINEQDLAYIDTVYKNMKDWEKKTKDGSEWFDIKKVAFFDFDGTGKMTFYVSYYPDFLSGRGFYINSDGSLSSISFGVYPSDDKTRHESCLTGVAGYGTQWNVTMTEEQKYEQLKTAYNVYLKRLSSFD